MASLDVMDWQLALDGELAKAGLERAYRGQAVKEARRLVDAMAFRFALMDERPMPEDLDYLRAIEAVKPAPRAAAVLLARRPIYARIRRRRRVTTYTSLGIFVLFVAALAFFGTSEGSVTLAEFSTTTSANQTFVVTENFTRLHVDATIIHPQDAISGATIFLNGPDGRVMQLWPAGDARNNYLRRNIEAPDLVPGEWTLLVDLNGGGGSVYVTLLGIEPRR